MLPPVHVVMDKLQHIAVESKPHGGPLPKRSVLLDDIAVWKCRHADQTIRVSGQTIPVPQPEARKGLVMRVREIWPEKSGASSRRFSARPISSYKADCKAVYSLALLVRDPECSNVALHLGKTSRPDWY
jgi:hypothetical protein